MLFVARSHMKIILKNKPPNIFQMLLQDLI